ncbi:MAG: glycosyltransferase family 4 protein [candidate division WOR-3 bacterium]
MRVLQIGYLPLEKGGESAGGIATHIWELSEALLEAGHRPEILAHNRRAPDTVVDGIPVHHFPRGREAILLPFRQKPSVSVLRAGGAARGSRLKGIGKAYWVRSVLEAAKPDLIHSHIPSFFFVPVARALGYRGPVVLSVHSVHDITYTGADPDGLARIKALFQDSLRLSDAIITVHPHVLEEARGLGLWWSAPARVIINAVNPKFFSTMPRDKARAALGLPTERRIVLFSGIMTGRKGEKELIRAFAFLKGEERLIMIGYGPREHEARTLISELGLSERITLVGPVPRERMTLYYNAADLFALPSHSEGFALSYMEAMLCGTPFLADKALPQELVGEGNCVLVDSRDPLDIARGITEALRRQWDRRRIADFGKRFAWGHEKLSEYLEVYRLAMENSACN